MSREERKGKKKKEGRKEAGKFGYLAGKPLKSMDDGWLL